MSVQSAGFRADAKVIALVGTAHGVSHFFQLLLAPLFPWIKAELGVSYAELGALMAVFYVVSGVGQAAAGFVVDRVGARAALFAGIGLLALAALTVGASSGYWGLAVGAGLAGLGNCVFHPADFTLLNRRVSAPRLAHAFSVHGISGSLGYAAAPVFLVTIAGVTGSWRAAVVCAAGVALAVLALLMFNRPLLADTDEAAAPVKAPVAGAGSTLAFLKLPQVWMCFAFFFVSSVAIGGIQNFAPTALHGLYGLPLTLATLAYTVFMLASAGGMVMGGFAAARSQRHDRLIGFCLAGAGSVAILLGLGWLPAVMVLPMMALIGLGTGFANPSRDLLVRTAAPKGATGRVYGTVYSGLDAGMAVAPVVFGLVMDAGHPAWVFIAIGGCQFLAILTAVTVGGDTRRRAEAVAAA